MKARLFLSIATFATISAAAAPTALHAESAMDACIKAFVEERVPKDRPIKIRKLRGVSASSGSQSGRITLTANGAKSGAQIASATCVVSNSGESVALYDAGKASKLAGAESARTGA